MHRPNIIFYFSDQQRWDTCGCYGQPLDTTPNLDELAAKGILFQQAFSANPVCGPCRSIFQTGLYPTHTGCFRNNIALPAKFKTVADYFEENGYQTAYVGKWHLASNGGPRVVAGDEYTLSAIPVERRGGYHGFWRASDMLELTSHGYDGYVFDENMKKREFIGYRADCITDFALEFIEQVNSVDPFFLTVSHIEPHHQNDRSTYEGPKGSKKRFANYILPGDLEVLKGNADEMYPDYLGCCRSVDDNLGRIVHELKLKGLFENTIIIYTSDHGSHFFTRNNDGHFFGYDDYKRSCHSASLRVPLVMAGPGLPAGTVVDDLVSTSSLPKTILAMAGIDVGDKMIGENLLESGTGKKKVNCIYAQISESRVARCVRTPDYLFSVYAPGKNGGLHADSEVYAGDFLYDLREDPFELNNVIDDPKYKKVVEGLINLLKQEMEKAGEKTPDILR